MTILGALIILFHPSEEQLARAVAMRSACDRLLVVDNSPLPDARAAMVLGEAGVALLHHGNRNGIAGAFNCGLSALFDAGADAVALFDQDSEAPDGLLHGDARPVHVDEWPGIFSGPAHLR